MENTACTTGALQLRVQTCELCIAEEMLMKAECFICSIILYTLHKGIVCVHVHVRHKSLRISRIIVYWETSM